MKEELIKREAQPVLFLDDWPLPPLSSYQDLVHEKPGLTEAKRWRLQTLMATNPSGIPLLGLAKAYEKMFGKELDLRDLGFENICDLVYSLSDIFTVQEPDSLSAVMFPDYPDDRILYDARFGYDFGGIVENHEIINYKNTDFESLISYAWLNRDADFSPDVVLAGEQYTELILPMTAANIPGTRGLHKAVIVSAANPNYFFVHINSDNYERIQTLSSSMRELLEESPYSIDSYSVPEEFIYPGFPCLVYLQDIGTWERCVITGRSSKGTKVWVETVDFGSSYKVNRIYLYLMPRKFFDIPKQSVLLSMANLKPVDDCWLRGAGSRIRCFSNEDYWLDVLLMDPKVKKKQTKLQSLAESQEKVNLQPSLESAASETAEKGGSESDESKKKRIRRKKEVQFEAIVCDRNDSELNVYLDKLLINEKHARSSRKRSKNIESLRSELEKAFEKVKRPENPLEKIMDCLCQE